MTQLIVGGVYLPQTSGDKYQCYPGELNVTVEMISGRTVIEQRGHVQMIVWSYDYMGNDLWRCCGAASRLRWYTSRTMQTRCGRGRLSPRA